MNNKWEVCSAHSNISLEYVSEQDWFYVKWSGHIHPDDVVAAATKFLELQQEKRCPKLLNDKSEVTGEWEEANDWLEYEWMPQVEKLGLQYLALVLSRDMHDLSTAQNLQRRVSNLCQVGLFNDVPSAQEWLSSFAVPKQR
ncbi:hypothetical protein [Rufibacter tibetensis]|uniref:STAS/SEC14 domain-containing protein n=1 Tax=Rufibacter tibetensis TaxID=512763 RepID=A0A0P0CM70_9BACT|nr:hypothetical protein [Rufibacter tibetensis]ALI97993.1 hypothetical protein DC20_02130 [Rufibacter tibetensis]